MKLCKVFLAIPGGGFLGGRRVGNPGGLIQKEVCLMCLRIFFKAFLMCLVLWGIGGGTLGAVTILKRF